MRFLMRPLKAYQNRLTAVLGYIPNHYRIQEAVNEFSHLTMREVRSKLVQLEKEFSKVGGRGIILADDIDALRISVAVRGRK